MGLFVIVLSKNKEPFFQLVEQERIAENLSDIVGGDLRALPVCKDGRYVVIASGKTVGKAKNHTASRLTGTVVFGTAAVAMRERDCMRGMSQYAAKTAVRNLFEGGAPRV